MNQSSTQPRSFADSPRQLPAWPFFDEEQIAAVAQVLRSGKVNYWTGDEVSAFEREFAEYVGAQHAVAVANGTVALELALLALGIGPGDEVIVPARTFIATASSVVMRGATPVVADVDLESQNLTARTVAPLITERTKAVIAVHLAGWPCEMDALRQLADRHGLKLIEDCAQAHGARYKGRPVGALGDVGCFSFCQDKIITTGGEGGMLVTSDAQVWERAWTFKDHGKCWKATHEPSRDAVFKWVHTSFGTNWRLTAMQAALGRLQLRRLDDWVATRHAHAERFAQRLSGCDALRIPHPPEHVHHSYYKFYAFVKPECLCSGWTRDDIVRALRELGVPCGSGICGEIYREQAFRRAGLGPAERLPNAARLGETSIMLPVHPTLRQADIDWMAECVLRVVEEATGGRRAESRRAA